MKRIPIEQKKSSVAAYGTIYRATHREERKAYGAAYRLAHQAEKKTSDAAYYEANREVWKARNAVYHLIRKFDVSRLDAELLVALRDGEGAWCDICRRTDGPFVIDHDHKTGIIRGILCGDCNHHIAALDNGFPLDAAFVYLRGEPNAG